MKKKDAQFDKQKNRTEEFQNKFNETQLKLNKAQDYLNNANKIVKTNAEAMKKKDQEIANLKLII